MTACNWKSLLHTLHTIEYTYYKKKLAQNSAAITHVRTQHKSDLGSIS